MCVNSTIVDHYCWLIVFKFSPNLHFDNDWSNPCVIESDKVPKGFFNQTVSFCLCLFCILKVQAFITARLHGPMATSAINVKCAMS